MATPTLLAICSVSSSLSTLSNPCGDGDTERFLVAVEIIYIPILMIVVVVGVVKSPSSVAPSGNILSQLTGLFLFPPQGIGWQSTKAKVKFLLSRLRVMLVERCPCCALNVLDGQLDQNGNSPPQQLYIHV